MEDCIFCKIANKEVPAEITYEDDYFISFVDLQPNNFGHSLLVPKAHYKNIYELSVPHSKYLGDALKTISSAVKRAMNADGINIQMNNDPAAGQVIFHAHFHIIPRFENDGLKHFVSKKYDNPNQIKETGAKIRNALQAEQE